MPDDTSKIVSDKIITNGTKPLTTEEYRELILKRNLEFGYSKDKPYENIDSLSLDNLLKNVDGKIKPIISNLLTSIPVLNAINPQNTLIGRLIKTNTPLEIVGNKMLGVHLAYGVTAHLSKKIGTFDVTGAIFKGGKLYHKYEDYSVTNNSNKSLVDKAISFGFFNSNIFSSATPFNSESNNITYIENTGIAQLSNFYRAINLNVYKPIGFDVEYDRIFFEYANKKHADISINPQNYPLINKNIFSFDNIKKNPYLNYRDVNLFNTVNLVNDLYIKNYNVLDSQYYAISTEDINDNYGKTNKTEEFKYDKNGYFGDINYNIKNRLVWGRDGVISGTSKTKNLLTSKTKNLLTSKTKNLRGNYVEDEYQNDESDIINNFNIKRGLLEYTRSLVNATSGQYIDMTKKVFVEGDKVVGFNGSLLFKSNDSEYAKESGWSDKTGVRQHTIIDQYDRYAKVIRFNGNKIYGGNENSIIFNSVIPKIHPKNKYDVRNLMFSIENLAIEVNNDGVIDGDTNSKIPLNEVGAFGGRIMWFPPYGLSFNETLSAKFDTTTLLGRNEPLYNYMNSERSMTINFIMIADYPMNLKNIIDIKSNDNKKRIAEFFAFGGNKINENNSDNDFSFIDFNDKFLSSSDYFIKNVYQPALHSMTPEDLHRRLTFLNQCTRQGTAVRTRSEIDNVGIEKYKNSVFGRQPICVLRIGDFIYSKIIVDNVNFDYQDTIWDLNPEGMGVQPMIVKVTLQVKLIGGQSLKGPVDVLQNAASFNYYANSTFFE